MKSPYAAYNWVFFVKNASLPPTAKYICLYLWTFMNSNSDIAWPSLRRISEETGLSLTTVKKYIKYLEENGWLTVSKRLVKNNKITQLNNEYRISIPDSEISKHLETGNKLPVDKPVDNSVKGGSSGDPRHIKGGSSEVSRVGRHATPNINNKYQQRSRSHIQSQDLYRADSENREGDLFFEKTKENRQQMYGTLEKQVEHMQKYMNVTVPPGKSWLEAFHWLHEQPESREYYQRFWWNRPKQTEH